MTEQRRYMGLDLGSKTIGVALSDLLGLTAQGYTVIQRTSLENDLARLKQICAEYDICAIVLGLPKNMNNSIGAQGEATQSFGELLREQIGCEVFLWDERLTSREAERRLIEGGSRRKRRRQVIDMVAATLILEGFLMQSGKKP